MNSILLCAAVGLLFGAGGWLLQLWAWGWAVVFGTAVFVVCWVLLARWLGKRLTPAMLQVRKQMEAGMGDAAMRTLRELLPMCKWVPLLRGQLLAQMGVLANHSGDQKQAIELLSRSSRRAADAQLLLACIHYKNGDPARAFQVLSLAAMVNKRHSLLHNSYAWLLHKEDRSGEAIALLAKFLQKEPGDEAGKDNLLRLQNKSRMSMKDFGISWYALGLERPPAEFGQLQTGRKGFRQPPKGRRQR